MPTNIRRPRKHYGIMRRVDDLGRVVIPAEFRRTLGIDNNDQLEIIMNGDHIELKRYSEHSEADAFLNAIAMNHRPLSPEEETLLEQHISEIRKLLQIPE